MAPDDAAPEPTALPNREGGRRLLLALVATLAAALLAEGAMQLALPLKSRRKRYARLRSTPQYTRAWVRHDPVLGFQLRPGLDATFRNPEEGGFATDLRTNRLGLRDDDASLQRPGVLFAGDSFAFGWGVGSGETVEAVFERQSGAPCLNLGQSGYGTTQALLLLERLAGELPLKGTTVVLLMFQNDLQENVGYGFGVYPRFDPRSGDLTLTTPIEEARFEGWLTKVSEGRIRLGALEPFHVPYLLARLTDKVSRLAGAARLPDPVAPPSTPAEREGLATLVLLRMRRFLAGEGSRLFAVTVPAVTHYTDGEPSGVEGLVRALEGASVPFLDATPLLGAEDYWLLDGHWKASGHRKVAEALVPALATLDLGR